MQLLRCAIAAVAASAAACNSHILVGSDLTDRSCGDAGSAGAGSADAGSDVAAASLMFWSTGFETGFGPWAQPPNEGFCYIRAAFGGASMMTVTSPVHSGTYAAAFTVNTDVSSPSQSRCLRQGVLPQSAYYSAWYYVPALATNNDNWNLFHFQGSNVPNGCVLGLWDVSLINDADGGLATSVYNFLEQRLIPTGEVIPINRWFRLEVFLRRAADNTGEFTLYQDNSPVPAVHLTGLKTDDTLWGQWYVGNYATALSPGSSTLYVDDVMISATGP